MSGATKERNVVIDVVKAFAIILMVMGHRIQYGFSNAYVNSEAYFDNNLFKIIYSFHMPLFMLISGYLFAFSINRDWKNIVTKKISNLLVPVFFWSAVMLFKFVVWTIQNNDFTFWGAIIYYLDTSVRSMWFLWAIFWCSLIVLIVNRLCNDNLAIYTLIFVVSFFVPDGLNLELYKFMYPYFVFGYFFNVKCIKSKIKSYCNYKLLMLFLVAFILLLQLYSYDAYIYTSRHSILNKPAFYQIAINLYRYIIGFIGSGFIILLFYLICQRCKCYVLSYVGRETMGIYILEGFVWIPEALKGISDINYGVLILETIYIVITCLLMTKLIKTNNFLSQLLLGIKIYR